jgi:hypothetical protein
MTLRLRRISFWALMIASQLVILETGCFLFTQLRPDLFDDRETALAMLQPEQFERFKQTSASNLLGWDNPAAVTTLRNCIGVEVTYSYDQARVRLHGERRPQDALILVTGDSYTQGADVSDEDTYPAALERILGAPVANLGVGGYGPDQALLKLETQIENFPRARVAILSILYDDTSRLVNSFRPVLNHSTGIHFGLKPFVRDGAFHPILGGDPFHDLTAMRAAAETAFDTDFWRRARRGFPYSGAVAEMISLPSFWIPLMTDSTESLGKPHYEVLHRIPSVRANLRAVYDRFANWTSVRGLRGVVAFIPLSSSDRTSGLVAISAATADQHKAVAFLNVEVSDWTQYDSRARARPGCHPTPAGYRMIANSVAAVVRPMLTDITDSSALRARPEQ